MAAPLLAAKLPHVQIAELLGVSPATISRWATDESVVAETLAIAEHAAEKNKDKIAQIVSDALDQLHDLVRGAEGEDCRLKAVDSTLDRFGHPKRSESKSEVEHSGATTQIAIVVAPAEATRLLEIAKGKEEDK